MKELVPHRGEGAPGVNRDPVAKAVWRELLASVDEALAAPVPSFASALDRDVFDISLPPAPGAAGDITADAVRAFAGMYLQAELEQAGVLIAAELLAGSRLQLPIRSETAARKLEAFAIDSRRWLTRDQRDYLFARVFGMGRAPSNAQANQDFQRLLLAWCAAVQAYDEETQWTSGAPGGIRLERVRVAAAALTSNLASRQYGNALVAARQINTSLKQAIDLLGDPGMLQHFRVRTMWDVIRRVFGELTPDIGRLVTRGQAGSRLIAWIADHFAWTTRASAIAPPSVDLRAAAAFAAQWMMASGISQTPPGQERIA